MERGGEPSRRIVTLICAVTTVASGSSTCTSASGSSPMREGAGDGPSRRIGSASRPCRTDPRGTGRDRRRGPDPLRVGSPWRTSSTSITSLRGAGSPSRGGTRPGPPGKGISPEGRAPGILPEPIRVRRCRNRCVFCFVHQLPKGLRRTLYVKDEDVRLSFLHGQYVTFSDLSDEETAKIVGTVSRRSTCRSTRPTRNCAGGCSGTRGGTT